MKIRIMKQDALDYLKSNLESFYPLYYNTVGNDWLKEIFDEDPFVDYKDIPSFNLANLSMAKGLIDFENCKIIYSNLSFLTESQASDERLWAGLSHDLFYRYLKDRWNMKKEDLKKGKDTIVGELETRFFFKGGSRSGIYRNTLAKCWWVGKRTFDSKNKFKSLEIIGPVDLNTKISEIFYNYNFNSNPTILNGIISGLEEINNEGLKYSCREHLRPTLQYINAVGGATLLDYWSSDDIRKMFVEKITSLINGDEEIGIEENTDDIEQVENVKGPVERSVALGDTIEVKNLDENKTNRFVVMFLKNRNGDIPPVPKAALNHIPGDVFEVNGKKYQLISII